MTGPEQTYVTVAPAALLEEVRARQLEGCRLVQICCTKLEQFEMTYSFARDGVFTHVRIHLPDATVKVPSISPIYSASFAYENEIHDLFGLSFLGLNIDYQGKFYKTTIPAPMVGTPVCGVPLKAGSPGAPAPADKGTDGQ
jgi:ech hydrogenase subunit D